MTDTNSAPEIVIHHIEGRRSLRVIWACEELQLPYRLVFEKGNVLGSLASIREAFPSMPVAPVVCIDGRFMVESGAIIEALAARYGNGRLAPTVDSPDYLHHLQWLHFAESSLMARAAQNMMLSMITRIPVNAFPPGYRSGIDAKDAPKAVGTDQCFDFTNEFLAEKRYFSGVEFGVSDISMHFAIRLSKALGIETSDYPNIHRWFP